MDIGVIMYVVCGMILFSSISYIIFQLGKSHERKLADDEIADKNHELQELRDDLNNEIQMSKETIRLSVELSADFKQLGSIKGAIDMTDKYISELNKFENEVMGYADYDESLGRIEISETHDVMIKTVMSIKEFSKSVRGKLQLDLADKTKEIREKVKLNIEK